MCLHHLTTFYCGHNASTPCPPHCQFDGIQYYKKTFCDNCIMAHSQKREMALETDDEPCHLCLSPEPESNLKYTEPRSSYDADVDSDTELGSETGEPPGPGHASAAWGPGFGPDSDLKYSKHNWIIKFLDGLESPKASPSPPPTSPDYCCGVCSPVSPKTTKRSRDATTPVSDRSAKRLRREDPELAFYDPVLAMLDAREQGAVWAVHFDPQLFSLSPGPSHHADFRSVASVTKVAEIGETELELVSDEPAPAAMCETASELDSSSLAARRKLSGGLDHRWKADIDRK